MFLNTELEEKGLYGVNMYALGVPHTILIDDYLPMRNEGGEY